jgi:micrococcal nuclease
LIGIDSPELFDNKKLYLDSQRTGESIRNIKFKGKKSLDFTKKLILNKIVKLEFDKVKFDKYGRLLAYVWLEDGTFVNAKIIKEGFAIPIRKTDNIKYYDLFVNLYWEAKKEKRGLWKYEKGG